MLWALERAITRCGGGGLAMGLRLPSDVTPELQLRARARLQLAVAMAQSIRKRKDEAPSSGSIRD